MPDIVLATLNAKYIHASFGLRYLMANLGGLRERACMAEFHINQTPLEITEAILLHEPRILGLGVYIWNVAQTTEVVGLLKRIRPELIIILGGPEVSYETDGQEIVALADHVITGEADVKFADVCGEVLAGQRELTHAAEHRLPACDYGAQDTDGNGRQDASDPHRLEACVPARAPLSALPRIIPADLPALDRLASPYDFYTDEDLAHRVAYVEASRGCPFTCEFCLSSLDLPVRAFPLDAFLSAMQRLLERGATQFKFVDRTFNLHLPTSMGILQFFLDRWRDGLFLHFEMIPDRLPEQLRALIKRFPPGAVQFEVGIQTFDDATSKNISRRQNLERLADNLRFLREETGVHVHADLIVGLPGEGMESFGRGFDRLVALGPQEIQVGILKRLRGTPIVRHDAEVAMRYAPHPPY
ncbi:MAG: radical SAM protein, partial [Chthoniobacteraceae bacterium]